MFSPLFFIKASCAREAGRTAVTGRGQAALAFESWQGKWAFGRRHQNGVSRMAPCEAVWAPGCWLRSRQGRQSIQSIQPGGRDRIGLRVLQYLQRGIKRVAQIGGGVRTAPQPSGGKESDRWRHAWCRRPDDVEIDQRRRGAGVLVNEIGRRSGGFHGRPRGVSLSLIRWTTAYASR